MPLPAGQFAINEMPRFGLTQFAERFPAETIRIQLNIGGDVKHPSRLGHEIFELPRARQVSDFHCVTTWSAQGLEWEGVRFKDLFEQIILPDIQPDPKATFVVFRCQDGYRSSLPLADALAMDVLIADRLNGETLSVKHGAPMRLVTPAHYGYKSAKHLKRIEFLISDKEYRPAKLRFMEHPRARVAFEERGVGVPGWILRYAYKPLIKPTIKRFAKALENHLNEG